MGTHASIGSVITARLGQIGDWLVNASVHQKLSDMRDFERHDMPWPVMAPFVIALFVLVASAL